MFPFAFFANYSSFAQDLSQACFLSTLNRAISLSSLQEVKEVSWLNKNQGFK
jgi:hypothetical protein